MTQPFIQPYLFFGGRCEEAIEFYKRAINAKLDMLMYHRESPDAPPPGMLQPGFEDKVMHASLRIGDSVVMASDGCDDKSKFDGFRLSLFLPTEAEARRVFDALAENGQVMMPLIKTFWSPCFGMLTDQFGVGWMVTVASPHEPLEQAAATQAQALGLAPPSFRDGHALTLGGLNATYDMTTRVGIPAQWGRFVPRAIALLQGQLGDSYGVCWNTTDDCKFDYLTAVELPETAASPDDFVTLKIPARRYAVFVHTGHVSAIPQTIDAIWTKWVPQCGLKIAQAPCFERYTPEFNGATGMGGMEIWIPLD